MRTMRVGELCQRANISRDTLRYYQREGLLSEQPLREPNGYRLYGEATLRRLQRIRYAKGLGFTLAEIRCFLDSWMAGQITDEQRQSGLHGKLEQLRSQQSELALRESALVAQVRQLACHREAGDSEMRDCAS